VGRKEAGQKWYVLILRPARTEDANDNTDATITLADRLHVLLTLFLITQTRAPNIPLFLLLEVQRLCFMRLLPQPASSAHAQSQALPVAFSSLLLSQTAYFAFGGSNSISSIDLSNAYNGVAGYNIVAVGVLLFASNWAGAIWWCSAAVTLLLPRPQTEPLPAKLKSTTSGNGRAWVERERAQLHADAVAAITPAEPPKLDSQAISGIDSWTLYTTAMTVFTAASLVAVMAACTLLRTHLFIWTVFSPKYLYAMAWAVGWHLLINLGLGRLLWRLGRGV
jgi:ethanolaminephosphotransferase